MISREDDLRMYVARLDSMEVGGLTILSYGGGIRNGQVGHRHLRCRHFQTRFDHEGMEGGTDAQLREDASANSDSR